jgi:hypothetical protein
MVDPMCNFFAGLVFLSVLAAVLSKNQSGSPWHEGEAGRTFANEELLDKRLAELRDETRNLQNQNRTASKNTTETASLPSLEAVEKALDEAADVDKKNGLEEEERGTASDILDLNDEIGENEVRV